jgi:hypothetical protein
VADDRSAAAEKIQLHLVQPYKIEVRDNRTVRRYLQRGYRIVDLQRVTDHEVLVTLRAGSSDSPSA